MPRRSGIVAALVLGRRYKSGLAFPEYNLKSAHLFLRELRSLAGRFARFHPTLKRGGLSASLSCKRKQTGSQRQLGQLKRQKCKSTGVDRKTHTYCVEVWVVYLDTKTGCFVAANCSSRLAVKVGAS